MIAVVQGMKTKADIDRRIIFINNRIFDKKMEIDLNHLVDLCILLEISMYHFHTFQKKNYIEVAF